MGLDMYTSQVQVNPPRKSAREESDQACMKLWDEKWRVAKEQFSPMRSAKEQLRVERLKAFLSCHLGGVKNAVDLACGSAPFEEMLLAKNIDLTLVDAASRALENKQTQTIRAVLPLTRLPENAFDLVIASDVIQDLPPRDHRLFLSELARLVTRDGCVFASTEVDVYSRDALHRFLELCQTEFEIQAVEFSHHRLLCHFGRIQSHRLCLYLEKLSRMIWSEQAISHVAWVGRRKRLGEKKAGDCL